MACYPASGEINRKVEDASATISEIRAAFEKEAEDLDTTDGISLSFTDWRFNLRMSNTEPVIRLNVESRGDVSLMEEKAEMLLGMIGGDLA
jgi:phosphomannomutase